MQGTALLLLTISVSIAMLLKSLFYPWKKIIETLDVRQQKQWTKKKHKNKKVDVVY